MIKQLIILAVLLSWLLPISTEAATKGQQLIPFSGPVLSGGTVDLGEVIGKKPVLLVFWASWCPSCKKEVPKINALYREFGPQGMAFIGINVGVNDSESRARKFAEQTEMEYPVYMDREGKLTRQYMVQGVPTLLIGDRHGRVVHVGHMAPKISPQAFEKLMK
jgi:peroxiredoxin